MKTIITLLFVIIAANAFAQSEALKKGNTVYIQQISANDNVKDYKDELAKRLKDWGYWKIADSKDQADFILDLNVDMHKGMTLTSWGGQTVAASAKLHSKSGEKLWQSETYETSPNGLNGFNGGRASIRKLVKGLKDKFN